MPDKRFFTRSAEESCDCIRDWCDCPYRTELCERTPDGKVNVLGIDGGAPEDQTFGRDWSWVQKALNKAYEDGITQGIFEGAKIVLELEEKMDEATGLGAARRKLENEAIKRRQ
jgi:hypothetical protein